MSDQSISYSRRPVFVRDIKLFKISYSFFLDMLVPYEPEIPHQFVIFLCDENGLFRYETTRIGFRSVKSSVFVPKIEAMVVLSYCGHIPLFGLSYAETRYSNTPDLLFILSFMVSCIAKVGI